MNNFTQTPSTMLRMSPEFTRETSANAYVSLQNPPTDAHVPIQITFKEEVSDHDGYCSGGECELTTRIYKKVIHVDVGEIANRLEYFTKYADEVICKEDGSYYCDVSDDAKTAGLQQHDHRVIVLNVESVETPSICVAHLRSSVALLR